MLEKLRLGNGNKQNKEELKQEYDKDPIEVLITPDGTVVSTPLDKQFEVKPQQMVAQSDEPLTDQEQNADKSFMPSESRTSTGADIPISLNKKMQSGEQDIRSTSRGQRPKANTQKTGKGNLKCGVSQEKVDRKRSCEEHMQHHTGNLRFSCDRCQKGFTRRDRYKTHMMKHDRKFYDCLQCDKKFESSCKFKSHMQRHIKFQCNQCQKGFTTSRYYQDHMKQHNGESYACQICGNTYTTVRSLQVHVQQHTGKYKYTCKICQKGFAKSNHFKDHMMKHEGKSYACQVCEKTFTTVSSLKRHMQHHTGNYSHICQICQKGFVRVEHLREHMMKHEGKTFTCHICEKTLSCPRTLEKHMNHHTAAEKGQ